MRGHDRNIVSLAWCPVPYNVFPQSTIRKITVKKDSSKENEKDVNDDNPGKNACANEIHSNMKINENHSIDTVETTDQKTYDMANIAESTEKDNTPYKNDAAESIAHSTQCDSKETRKTEILPLDKDTNTYNDNLSNSTNDTNSNKEVEKKDTGDVDMKSCDDLGNSSKDNFDNVDSKGTQNVEVSEDVDAKNDDASNTNKEVEKDEALAADMSTKTFDNLDNSNKVNSDDSVSSTNKEIEKIEALSAGTGKIICDDVDNSNKTNLDNNFESPKIQNDENNADVNIKNSEVSDKLVSEAVIENKDDDSIVMCEKNDVKQLKKEFLLASSSKGGYVLF